MKKLLTFMLLIAALILIGCSDNFSVEDLTGNWLMIRDDGEIAVGRAGGYRVMILNEDGTGLSGDTGWTDGVSPMTWEIRNGNHLYLIGNATLRLEIASYDNGVLKLEYLDFLPFTDTSIYIRVDYIELTDDMIQQ